MALGVTFGRRTEGSHEGVEEHINGGDIARSSSDLEMPYEDSGPSDPQLVALRFQNINVPPGAVIEYAYVQFLADSEKLTGGPVNLIIWGQKELNPGNFTSDINFMVSTAPGRMRLQSGAIYQIGPAAWRISRRGPRISPLSSRS